MKRRTKILAGAGLLAAVIALGLWLAAPSYVRSQIHKRHPEVSFETLKIGWRKVTLYNVTIDKGWIVAKADTAVIDTSTEAVHLVHGTVDVNFDKRPERREGVKAEQPNVTAEDFTVTVASAKHEVTATLKNVTVTDEAIRAVEADVRHKWLHVLLGGLEGSGIPSVWIARDFSHAKFGLVDFPDGLSLPPPFPEIVHPGITGIEVDLEKRTVSVESAMAELAEDQSAHARIEGGHFALDGDKVHVLLDTLYVAHPRIASMGTPVSLHHVAFDISRDMQQAPFDVKIVDATLHVDPEKKSVSGDELCSTWVKALPPEMAPPPIGGQTEWGTQPKLARMQFSLGLLPKPHFALSGNCSASCNDPALVKLKHHFSYVTYDEKGQRKVEKRETGPDDPDWVPLAQISENMLDAVANMEDWGFWSHHGYVAAALEQSFIEDVKTDKFSRGGSTVTMQTAKNVFLARDKTIGRKVSELFLSQVLESCFSKKEIMELYLNVVEFGPNVYGLRQAATYYFKEEPMQLNPQEAFYLAWILPRPRNSPPPNNTTLSRVTNLMRILSKNGRISEAQLLSIEPADTRGWEAYP